MHADFFFTVSRQPGNAAVRVYVCGVDSIITQGKVNGSMCAIGPSELEGYVTGRTYSDGRAPDAGLSAQRRAVSLSPRKARAQVVATELKNSNLRVAQYPQV